jgi:hypothetical protein
MLRFLHCSIVLQALPAVYYYTYADDTDCKTCVVYDLCQLGAFRI